MNDYDKTLEWLYTQLPAFETSGKDGYKPGLATTEGLDRLFGTPSKAFRAVHIAGTNGKGSTAHSLAAVLQQAGYTTGLFTSPHLVDFCERIRVNGEMISRDFVVDFVRRYKEMPSELRPTFFELTTIMAFDWFRQSGVDIAVIETGLGGRLDSTNIITPILSVITNISLDHTDLLGNTLEAIAAEKAGIIKRQVPAVVGEGGSASVRDVFRRKAAAEESATVFADEGRWFQRCEYNGLTNRYIGTPFGDIDADLTGECQTRNMATILAALTQLRKAGIALPDEAVRHGLAKVCGLTHLIGRWTVVSETPLTVIDTGHNPGGWQYTAKQIAASPVRRRHLVVGFVSDKDVSAVVEMIAQIPDIEVYATQPQSHRALPCLSLAEMMQKAGITAAAYPTVAEAVKAAKEKAATDDLLFIGGSNYLVGEYLKGVQQCV